MLYKLARCKHRWQNETAYVLKHFTTAVNDLFRFNIYWSVVVYLLFCSGCFFGVFVHLLQSLSTILTIVTGVNLHFGYGYEPNFLYVQPGI